MRSKMNHVSGNKGKCIFFKSKLKSVKDTIRNHYIRSFNFQKEIEKKA